MTETSVVPVDQLPAPPAESTELAAARSGAEGLLRGALAQLDQLVEAHAADVEGQARTYALVAKLTADLKSLTEAIANNLIAHMPDKRIVVEGVGVFERKTAVSNTAWQQDELWSAVRRFAADPAGRVNSETGELEPEAEAVIRIAREMLSPGSWRKTALRARGIDPDEVSSVNWGRKVIAFMASSGEGK